MRWARMVAILLTGFFLLGVILSCIGLLVLIGPLLVHRDGSEHVEGRIVQITYQGEVHIQLREGDGTTLTFVCRERCLGQIEHIERHLTNRANTDIYFMRVGSNELIAVDVD